jgi:hypothetical protein
MPILLLLYSWLLPFPEVCLNVYLAGSNGTLQKVSAAMPLAP